MTREEAVKILEEIIDAGWLISDLDKCIAIDACEMAIEALEQKPCEDVMHRDRTVQDFADKCRECGKQKKGKWIPIPFVLDYESDAKCSLCQKSFIDAIDYNYCPNCGAKMTESEE